jgi:hypothetical protein
MFKIFCISVFILFSFLQINDTDKYLWILLYLFTALVFIIKMPLLRYLQVLLLSTCSILFVVTINNIISDLTYYEPYYELGGIILIISACFLTIKKETLNEKR